jgi:hypothetical protein
MTEYNRMASGYFTSTGSAQTILLSFQPQKVNMIYYTATAAFTANLIPNL